VLAALVLAGILAAPLGTAALLAGELFRKLTAFLVATVPVLVLLGLVRAVALLRRGTGASWRDSYAIADLTKHDKPRPLAHFNHHSLPVRHDIALASTYI
jgi:exosortase/archaeosortase